MSPLNRLLHRQAGPAPPPQLPQSYLNETDKEEVIGVPAVFTGLAFIIVLLRIHNDSHDLHDCVLGLGFFASAAGVVKSIYQYNFFSTLDWSFHDSFMVWAFIELNIGIIAASLPSLKPLFNWLLKTARTLGSGLSSHARQYNSPSLAYGQSDRKEPKVTGGYVLEPIEGRTGVPNRAPSRAKNLYGVHISSGEDIHYITSETTWEPPRSERSDDFILPKRRPPTPEAGILMTTEFRVS
ncbi:MAG: hypothetical protein Q9160_006816 [Pyrenula sp. 1 TL-2023]